MKQSGVKQTKSDPSLVIMNGAVRECRTGSYRSLPLIVDYVNENGLSMLQMCFGLKDDEYDQWLLAASSATFSEGQLVHWSPYGQANRIARLKVQSGYGEGPFLVEKVEALSRHCTCGEIIDQNGWHSARCDMVQLRLHHQRLTLLTPKGSLVVSGRLLQPVK